MKAHNLSRVLLVAAICAFAHLHINTFAQNTWTSKANFGGGNRVWATCFSIGTKGYVGTGQNSSGRVNDFWEYNPATNVWTQKAVVPGGGRGMAFGFSIGTKGYIGGGISCCAWLNSFYEYDPATNVWTSKAVIPTAVDFSTSFSIGTKGYVGTGRTSMSGRTNVFYEYNPATNVWTSKAAFPGAARSQAVSFSIGNKGYIGGGAPYSGASYSDFYEYDPATNAWTKKADLGGGARVEAVGFAIGSRGYVGLGPGADFWEYNPTTNVWTKKTADYTGGSRPEGAVGFSIGCKAYVGLGYQTWPNLLQDFYEYTVPPSATPPVVTASSATSFCKGDSVVLKTDSVYASYLWSTGDTLQKITVKTSGSYTLGIPVTCGTVTSSPMKVTVNNLPNAQITGKNKLCTAIDSSTTLTASGGVKYLWSTSDTTANITVQRTQDTSYTVTVTDTNNCKKDTSIAITVTVSPVAVITGKTSICVGDSTTLTASGGDKYQWNTSAADSISSITVKPITDSIYKITVANGICTDSTFVTVKLNVIPNANAGKDTSICKGNKINLNASGGTTYSWTPTTGLSDSAIANPIVGTQNFVSLPTTINYVVYVANGGCVRTDTVAITINPLPVVNAGQDVIITRGNSIQLSAGTQNYASIQWTPSIGLSNANIANPLAAPEDTTTYIVIGTDSNGCSSADTIVVRVELKCGELFIPNAFSPNGKGDTENETVKVYATYAKCISEISFFIYNRWGEKVFETTDLTKGWDGTYKGNDANSGVYVFYLNASMKTGEQVTKTGNISLIR